MDSPPRVLRASLSSSCGPADPSVAVGLQKKQGYFTSSAGKIFHDGMDDPQSWSYPSNQTHWIQCQRGDIILNESYGNYCAITAESAVPYSDGTITVFHADHGYQLGELNEWSKKTDTELATRVPMIIRVRHTICRLSRFGAGLLR